MDVCMTVCLSAPFPLLCLFFIAIDWYLCHTIFNHFFFLFTCLRKILLTILWSVLLCSMLLDSALLFPLHCGAEQSRDIPQDNSTHDHILLLSTTRHTRILWLWYRLHIAPAINRNILLQYDDTNSSDHANTNSS